MVDFINSWAGVVKEIEALPDPEPAPRLGDPELPVGVEAALAKRQALKTPAKCNHDWPEKDGQTDMDGSCTKCGMSFQYYIYMECP